MGLIGWLIGTVTVGVLGLGVAVLRIRRRIVVVTVEGTSMAPTLADGERVVVRRRRIDQVHRGDVVVLEPPPQPSGQYAPIPTQDGHLWNIKRAVALPGDPLPEGVMSGETLTRVPPGALVVLGDNPDSIDSRQRGFFSADQLLGVAVRRLGGPAL